MSFTMISHTEVAYSADVVQYAGTKGLWNFDPKES